MNSKVKLKFSVIIDALIGDGTVVNDHVNLYKCQIGKNCKVSSFVYVEEGVIVGNNCKIKPFVFIPTGVTIGNNVFVGPGVVFTNDKYPKVSGDWTVLKTIVEDNVSIGAGAVILPGLVIGKNALIAAGAVVTKNVPANAVVAQNPARLVTL